MNFKLFFLNAVFREGGEGTVLEEVTYPNKVMWEQENYILFKIIVNLFYKAHV